MFSSDFGVLSSKKIMSIIFYIGFIPIFLCSIFWTYFFGITRLPFFLGYNSFGGSILISYFFILLIIIIINILALIIWRLVCELLYLVFHSLEIYINKNDWRGSTGRGAPSMAEYLIARICWYHHTCFILDNLPGMNMKRLILFGDAAVRKMTVGQELMKVTEGCD